VGKFTMMVDFENPLLAIEVYFIVRNMFGA